MTSAQAFPLHHNCRSFDRHSITLFYWIRLAFYRFCQPRLDNEIKRWCAHGGEPSIGACGTHPSRYCSGEYVERGDSDYQRS
jgi:hypothetical protein